MVYKLQRGHDFVTETATYKVQRGKVQKYIYPRVMVLALCTLPNVVNNSMTCHEDILNVFQVTERTRFCDGQTDGQTTMAKTICLPTLKWGDIKLSLQTPKLVFTSTRSYT